MTLCVHSLLDVCIHQPANISACVFVCINLTTLFCIERIEPVVAFDVCFLKITQ
jgi:hypothetical protein